MCFYMLSKESRRRACSKHNGVIVAIVAGVVVVVNNCYVSLVHRANLTTVIEHNGRKPETRENKNRKQPRRRFKHSDKRYHTIQPSNTVRTKRKHSWKNKEKEGKWEEKCNMHRIKKSESLHSTSPLPFLTIISNSQQLA